jgi:hypothetical protein
VLASEGEIKMRNLWFAGRTDILRAFPLYFILLITCGLILSPPIHADAQTNQPATIVVVENSSPSDGISIDVLDLNTKAPKHLLVPDSAMQARLKALNLQKGDYVKIVIATDKEGHEALQLISVQTVEVHLQYRLLVLLGCVVGYLLLCLLLTFGNPLKLVIGEDGHYSNSKFQMALWFGVLIVSYLATVVLRAIISHDAFLGNVGIPNNLLLLSGMSALTFAGAKGITTAKVQAAVDSGNPSPKPYTNTPRFFSDLTHNDRNQLDFGDFQMIVVTFVAVGMYVVLMVHFLGFMEMRATVSLPDVDTTILATFGLGQGAYLTKKAVGNVGDT